MKRLLCILPFIFAIMIVVLHNVVPHHHHLDVAFRESEAEPDPCSEDHCPDKCILDNINLDLPKGAVSAQIQDNSISTGDAAGDNNLKAAVHLFSFSYFHHSERVQPSSFLEDLPPRAPPC